VYADGSPVIPNRICLCSHCGRPTFFELDSQTPGPPFGADVQHLPSDIEALYREARNCTRIAAYTAGAMACRKVLMNVAVDRGAPENQSFAVYVDFLDRNGWVPPNGKQWVNHIRTKGNEATHQILPISKADLEDLLVFVEMLLRVIFEFPKRLPAAGAPPAAGS
jgi:hypothetical protein